MKDFDDHRSDIVDSLMEGQTIERVTGADILDGDVEWGEVLNIFKAPRDKRLDKLDLLERRIRKVIARFVRDHMDEEVTARLESAREDHDEYEPTI